MKQATEQEIALERLAKIIAAFEWGSIQKITCEDGVPTGVDVLVHFSLRESVSCRLRKLLPENS